MTKLSTQNSGIHIEPFFTTHKLSGFELEKNLGEKYYIEIPDFIIQEEAKGNYDVEDFHNDEEEMLCEVKNNLIDDALMYETVFEPRIYNEEAAYMCDLIPFTLWSASTFGEQGEKYKFLSFGGCVMDMTYKLEAYQVLANGSYDPNSNFADKGIKYFEHYYGKESGVVKKIEMLINNNSAE